MRWTRRIGLTVLSLFVGFPLYVMVSVSVQSLADVGDSFRWIPQHVTLAPYRDMWTTLPLRKYLLNSLLVSTVSTVLAVAVAVPTAYALSRHRFRGNGAVATGLVATQAVPGILFLVPLFLIYAQLERTTGIQLIGSYAGLVVTDLTFSLPVAVGMLAAHFATLPRDVEEAAMVDGAGALTVLARIVVPAASGGIVAVGTFAFTLAWGEVLFASVLTDDRTSTLPIGLQGYSSQSLVYWDQLFAASLVAALPVLAVFVGLRRFVLRRPPGGLNA